MSDAKVKFYATGSTDVEAARGFEAWFSFVCPRGNRCGGLPILGRTKLKHDPQNQNGGVAHWTWDGNRDRPTFSPSINCTRCWHGFIENGRCVGVDKKDEPEPKAR